MMAGGKGVFLCCCHGLGNVWFGKVRRGLHSEGEEWFIGGKKKGEKKSEREMRERLVWNGEEWGYMVRE